MMTRTRHDIELAKKFMHLMDGATPNLEDLCKLITTARVTLPSPARDVGPWSYGTDGQYFIESDDFTHDVRFYLDGDFAHDEQRSRYLEYVTGLLNAATPDNPMPQPPLTATAIAIEELTPPQVTGADIKRRQTEGKMSLFDARQQLFDERLAVMLHQYSTRPHHLLLSEILQALEPRNMNRRL